MRKGIIIKGVTPHNATTVFWAHIFHFFVSFKLHVTLYYWFLIEMVFSCSLLKKHPYSVDFKGVNCRRFLFQHYLFRTFSSGVAWSFAFWALSYCPRATGRLLKTAACLLQDFLLCPWRNKNTSSSKFYFKVCEL